MLDDSSVDVTPIKRRPLSLSDIGNDEDDDICPTQAPALDTSISDDNNNNNNDNNNNTSSSSQGATDTSQIWGELLSLGDKVSTVKLSEESLVVGRLKTCNVTIPEMVVSAKHCRLFKRNDSIFIQDLSTNGTFVNGRPVGRGNLQVVKNGDTISFASASTDNQLAYMLRDMKLDQKLPQQVWQTLARKKILTDYDIIGELGRGTFSVVYLGVNKNNATKVAIKDIDLAKYQGNPRYMNQLNREIDILRSIRHPNIVHIHEIFQSDQHVFIVMELATGGELYEKLENDGSLSESDARLIFIQLLKAVEYLHSLGIAHRDLKPENILFDYDQANPLHVKVTDFGLARVIGQGELAKTLCGSPLYIAPEVIVSKTKSYAVADFNKGYGFSCDAWSLGALLYVILSGDPPFDDDSDQMTSTPTIFTQIMSGDISYPEHIWNESLISKNAQHLVKRLLTVDPNERITIKEALNHPWITTDPSSSSSTTITTNSTIIDRKRLKMSGGLENDDEDYDGADDPTIKKMRTIME
ncbi:hypothetical protein SAMD00019534_002320 [Acytostelium subglobosum LB1]|uniref:hypothetical protein n=1 Tax=Acytostelium subglobosum LB1 TaxID=1410327 RepID=UPI000644C558|nr:hypothetical protein SAMD00019534_002320 [Acytostelium subglobosum LB1]GAM17057.1 hypothetical protein SAMD00019534_002320 [Acytostelium subglobosum LB1]|eukprot:XP_012759119.1 hypothetical protein SAMD00019534_002320 [Acytostelium subglobosum LB1]